MIAPEFWKTKTLAEMTGEEWEALCDGCGRCCLLKLEDEETGAIEFTGLACHLLNTDTCRCRNYKHRARDVPDCVRLTPENIGQINWLPASCAYRRIREGRGLADWHYLVSGNRRTVHDAGISVQGRVLSEEGIHADDYETHVIHWIE